MGNFARKRNSCPTLREKRETFALQSELHEIISWNNYKLERKQDRAGCVIRILTHVKVIWLVINARNQLASVLHSPPGLVVREKASFPFNGVSRLIFMLPSSRISAITYANNPFPIVHNADSRFIGAVIYVAERFVRL